MRVCVCVCVCCRVLAQVAPAVGTVCALFFVRFCCMPTVPALHACLWLHVYPLSLHFLCRCVLPQTGKGKLRHLFVFNDLVVMSRLPKKSGGKFTYETQLRLHNPLGPADAVEYEGKYARNLPFAFELVTPSSQWLLSVSDQEQQRTWLCVLNDAIEELQLQNAYFEKQKEKVAQENAKAAKAMLAQQVRTPVV
jgi:hypothetical protein